MKSLFLTYSTLSEPYLTLAKKLGEDIRKNNAGDFQLVKINHPGGSANFYTVVACLLYSYIIRAINLRPVIVLDCDHSLEKPADHLFEADWDIGVVFRFPQLKECGRQDYCGGLVALNNRRPNIIRKFWIEWINKTEFWEKIDSKEFPKALKNDGWKPCWYADQGSLNQIILPECNQNKPEDDSYKITAGQIYEIHGYKILPLERRLYGAKISDSKDAYIIHYKGKTKRERLKGCEK